MTKFDQGRPARQHSRWKRLLLLSLGTITALGVAELGCRVWGAVAGAGSAGRFTVDDSQLGWRNRPDYTGRHSAADFDVEIQTDSAGRRVAAPEQAPAAGERQLVHAIGDSTTFGWGVEYHQSWVAELEDAAGVDAINFGVSGYGSDQQLLVLRNSLAASVPLPDLVVVTHSFNDVEEVLADWQYRRPKPRFVGSDASVLRLAIDPLPPPSWLQQSHLWRMVSKRLAPDEHKQLTADERERGRALVKRIYRAMSTRCRDRDVGLVLCGLQSDWLRAFAVANEIPYFDITPAFETAAELGPPRFASDPHWTPIVHAQLARDLAAFCVREGLLEPR